MIKVKVVVKNGFVQEVRADVYGIDVEVLDMDTNDVQQREEKEREYSRIVEDYPYIIY